MDSDFTIKKILANGLEIAYIEAGSGPLVLLIHGFPDNAWTWSGVLPKLAAAGFHAVAIFTRGYFPSQIPADGDYSAASMGRDVLGVIAALGESSAIVIGHDFGATIAYAAANLQPESVRKLVTLAIPHPKVVKLSLRILRRAPHFLLFQFGPLAEWRVRKNNFAYIDYLYHYWSPSWQVPPRQTESIKSDFARPGRLKAALSYYRFLVRDKFNKQRAELYQKNTSVPTLCFIGAEDMALSLGMFNNMASAFSGPYELITVPGAGHFVHLEQPDFFWDKLKKFLL